MDDMLGNKSSSEEESSGSGVNPYELPNLPERERKVLQIILRKREISYHDLVESIEQFIELNEDADLAVLDETLERLSSDGHIIILFEGEETTFKPNLRRKSGRNVLIKGIWDVLDSASETVDQAAKDQRFKTGNILAHVLFPDAEKKPQPEQSHTPEGKQLASDIFGGDKINPAPDKKAQPANKNTLASSLFGALEDAKSQDDDEKD